MERLIDDVLILDFNRVLVQCPVNEFMSGFRQFYFELDNDQVVLKKEKFMDNLEQVRNTVELYTWKSLFFKEWLKARWFLAGIQLWVF